MLYPLKQVEQPLRLNGSPAQLGEFAGWISEWHWLGVRVQLVRSKAETSIWSDGCTLNDLVCDLVVASAVLPNDIVLDGVVVGWDEGEIVPLSPNHTELRESSCPMAFFAYDLLELDSVDIRQKPLMERRSELLSLLTPGALDAMPSCRGQLHPSLRVGPDLRFSCSSWEQLAQQAISSMRLVKADGVLLRRACSSYEDGDWYLWGGDA